MWPVQAGLGRGPVASTAGAVLAGADLSQWVFPWRHIRARVRHCHLQPSYCGPASFLSWDTHSLVLYSKVHLTFLGPHCFPGSWFHVRFPFLQDLLRNTHAERSLQGQQVLLMAWSPGHRSHYRTQASAAYRHLPPTRPSPPLSAWCTAGSR